MYSFTPECIYNASKNLTNLDDKVGGFICILSTLELPLLDNKIYKVNLAKLKNTLQKIFDISLQNLNYTDESWYIVLSKNWISAFFEKIIKNKIDILSLAVFFLRRNSFQSELSEKEIINLFIDKFNLMTIRNIWFKEESTSKLKYNQIDNESNQKEFYKMLGITAKTGALKFNGTTIMASATELQRCAQIQTLYAGMDMNSILLLNKNNLNKSYKFGNSDASDNSVLPQNPQSFLFYTKSFSQIIFYGVPGCGKSYKIDEITKNLPEEQVMRVVFHPDYTNSDFVGQIVPALDSDGIDYKFKAGPFSRILKRALKNPSKKYFLIIEEINRGNAAAIFGDLFQLLDRNIDGWSSYSIENLDINSFVRSKDNSYNDKEIPSSVEIGSLTFTENTGIRLPPNLSILATMNTSDQNVFTLDNAFQRRWSMEYVPNKIDYNSASEEQKNQYDSEIGETGVKWGDFRNAINDEISNSENSFSNAEDKQLGLFFVQAEGDISKNPGKILENDFANKVLKYLWNDVFKRSRENVFNDDIKTFGELLTKCQGQKALENCFKIKFEPKSDSDVQADSESSSE